MTQPQRPQTRVALLLGFWAVVLGVFAILHWWTPLHRYGLRRDEIIIGGIGVLFLLIGIGMLPKTQRWGARELGIWGVSLSIGIWFSAAVWDALYLSHDVPWAPPALAIVTDLIRALFICAGLLLLWAYAVYWVKGDPA